MRVPARSVAVGKSFRLYNKSLAHRGGGSNKGTGLLEGGVHCRACARPPGWLVGLALVCAFLCAFVSAFVCSFRCLFACVLSWVEIWFTLGSYTYFHFQSGSRTFLKVEVERNGGAPSVGGWADEPRLKAAFEARGWLLIAGKDGSQRSRHSCSGAGHQGWSHTVARRSCSARSPDRHSRGARADGPRELRP